MDDVAVKKGDMFLYVLTYTALAFFERRAMIKKAGPEDE